ncbi:hypothetical protein JCM17846_25110 [Iodidimonas nitroreducens]|uniref:Uncharacterized protein n=1 Tax=Iodidimonas nitroreducens TaxID=1236968 RepID=A0A5A7NCN5_9PROT|nr:hypothetical protein JCM17846_25110 [Iodidimonas nitroreducens]
MDKVRNHPRQIAVLICGLAILLLGLVFHQTLMSMVLIWLNSSTYGHGLLIAPISLYLIWNNRHRLAALPIKASFWGLVWLLGAALLWLLGDMAQINLISILPLSPSSPALCWRFWVCPWLGP